MAYQHGIRVEEQPTSISVPVTGTSGLQVIFGTAPINQAKDPNKAANELFFLSSFKEAAQTLGYSDNFKKYTLCQSMDASLRKFSVAPIIMCNVLDPTKHKKNNEEQQYPVSKKQVTINIDGVLLDTIVVKNDNNTLSKDTDYVTSFTDNGHVIITFVGADAEDITTVFVSSNSIDPDAVTDQDLIGGYDINTGKETGIELVRRVYPKFQMVPGLLLAPGWSHKPDIGIALASKCESLNGLFGCECVLDLDTTSTGAKKYTDCADLKNRSGYINKHSIVVWPQLLAGTKQYAFSALYAAMVVHTDISNGDIPSLSPSNKLLGVSAAVLDDGTEIDLDQQQANLLNSQGIVTAINSSGWRAWGNNTACYPAITDPKDRWICCRRFFTWWGNSFILTYANQVDNPANYRLIESICDSENIRGNSYKDQGKCAGARIEFRSGDNPVTDILNGKIQFHQFLAPYTPAEDILNVLEFDPAMIEAALGGA